jgi:hypothetical protein
MTNYAEASKILLQTENPKELDRLKQAGILDEVMRETQKTFSQHEAELTHQIISNIPKDLPEMERIGRENMARMTAREVATVVLAEFPGSGISFTSN